MFSSVLIANRGEIAVRIARTAKRLGLRTIAVYSDADARSLHVSVCDEAVPIGPSPPRESYLAIDRIVAAALQTGAQCVHPGYGFLSENADFAEACAKAGLVFVGPPPAAIRAMGLKDRAKSLMDRAGVPVVPGYFGEQQTSTFLKRKAYEIGYPVLIKATAGGGGRGMRRVDKHAEFEDALASAQREAQSAFGEPRVLVEKYIDSPRHIEIQILADRHGNVLHLNERDCSLQRRHQKVIEEAPAPGMTPAVRAEMGRVAIEAARAIGYVGAGTIEFIAEGSAVPRIGGFWFMEMNTRLQVEHPVTEAITGLDLVEWQFRVAAGEQITFTQNRVAPTGHAIEARIYAEDPDQGFLPSPGRILALEFPQGEGIRVDEGVAAGQVVPPDYDPMIAKIIAHAPTRTLALDRLAAALRKTVVVGPRVNTSFVRALVEHPEFDAGHFNTGFIERHLHELLNDDPGADARAVACAVTALLDRDRERLAEAASGGSPAHPAWTDPWSAGDGFSLGPPRRATVDVAVDGIHIPATVSWDESGHPRVRIGDISADNVAEPAPDRMIEVANGVVVVTGGRQSFVTLYRDHAIDTDHAGDGAVKAPMNGRLVAVLVAPGQRVRKGTRVAVLEAMKMEQGLAAPVDGVVTEVAAAGTQVVQGAAVVRIAAEAK